MDRIWMSVELHKGAEENMFRKFLDSSGITYESSGAWNLVHFSCLMNGDEAQLAAEVLDEMNG